MLSFCKIMLNLAPSNFKFKTDMKAKSLILSLFVLAAMLFSQSASAQLRLGVGYGLGQHRVKEGNVITKSNGSGFYLTGTYNIDLLSGNWGVFGIEPGLVYSYYGDGEKAVETGLDVKASLREHYLDIPVFAKYGYDFIPGTIGAYAFLGPAFSFGLASHTRATVKGQFAGVSIDGKVVTHNYSGKITVKDLDNSIADELTNEVDKDYGIFDFKLGIGAGLKIIDCIDFRFGYNFGLVNRHTGDAKSLYRHKMNQFYFGFAYLF